MFPLQSSDITLTATPSPLGIVLGREGVYKLSFSNSNTTERAYNLSATVTIPNGVSYVSASVTPNSVVTNVDNSITIVWTNIKDLAPNELNYSIDLNLKSDENFRGTPVVPVPFDTPISAINVSASVDSMPRGSEDIGNNHIIKTATTNFIPKRYSLKKSAPGKIPKGAALPANPGTAARWPFQYTLEVVNNTREPSTGVTLIDDLPNGVRYLDDLTVTGTNIAPGLNSPSITYPTPPSTNFVILNWTGLTLPANSSNTVRFWAAVYNNYTVGGIENSGGKIPHQAPMVNNAALNGASGLVNSSATTAAMDALINKSINMVYTDVGQQMRISLNYKINQYDNVSNFTIDDILPNGTQYNTTPPPTFAPGMVHYNPSDGTTILTWPLGFLGPIPTGTDSTIDFYATVLNTYVPSINVSAYDGLTNNSYINGNNVFSSTPTPDSSSASVTIEVPSIAKVVTNYYYKDGTTVKPMNVAAPGDLVEFRITYNAGGITAVQHSIEVDEYPPLNMGPLSSSISAIYTGLPSTPPPVTVSPNGLRWILGDLPSNTVWTATFKVPVQNIDYVGTRNNLAKLAGVNTAGLGYSDRALPPITFGKPNISLNKSVAGPNVNAIKAGETYTYTVNIANPQNVDNTVVDAFQMDFTDLIPTGLTYAPGSASIVASPGTIYTTPVVVGQNLSMTVSKMPPNGTLALTYSVTVDATIGSGAVFTNAATLQRPFSQSDRSYRYPGSPFLASATLRSRGVQISKLGTPNPAKVGDTVTYIINVTVPAGTTVYNLKVTDNYPSSSQLYLGNATRNGIAVIPTKPPPAGTVEFPVETTPITATTSDVVITYSFDVRITSGRYTSPYTQNQTNSARVNWDTTPSGSTATVSTSYILTVITPNIIGTKNQRNVTQGGPFTAALLDYNPGDVIEYKISLTNNGAAPAYNISLTDTIDSFLSIIIGSISVTSGSYSYTAPTLSWSVPSIAAGNTATITFRVNTLPGIGANAIINDSGTFTYSSNNNGFGRNYGPISSNIVQLRSPRLTIIKTSDVTEGKIGDVINYTLTVTVPQGTIGYKVSIDDILPTGETYVTGSATLQVTPPGGAPVPITPDLISEAPAIRFVASTTYDASLNSITVIVAFQATIVSATHNPPYTEIQTNTAVVRWAIVHNDGPKESSTSQISITAKTPNVTVLKEQAVNNYIYTTGIINNVLPGDTINYRFTITNNGAAPAYNIVLWDNIDSSLFYNGMWSGPTLQVPHNPLSDVGAPIIPPPPGTIVGSITIPVLYNGDTATWEVSFTLDPISGLDIIYNQATFAYSTNEAPKYFVTYNGSSNTVTLSSAGLNLAKDVLPATAAVGDTVTYTLTVTVPKDIYAYNLTLEDVIPLSQQYVSGSANRDGGSGPLPISPTTSGNSIIFTDPETTILGPRTIIYTFDALILTGNINFPYTEIQTNSAIIRWRLSLDGTLAPPATATETLTVTNPYLTSLKEQRILPAGAFTTDPLMGVVAGDQIEYRISLTNDGASDANSIIITDEISPYLIFIPDIPPNPFVLSSVPGGFPDGTITCDFTGVSLFPSATISVVLKFQVISGFVPGTMVINQASTQYRSNPATSQLGPANSNKVSFNYVLPKIEKSCNKEAVISGNIVTYTIKITIPRGSTAYNVRVQDQLQSGQTYGDNYTITPSPPFPNTPPTVTVFPAYTLIEFENLGNITDTSASDVVITYTYDALLTAQTDNPQEIQTNEATLLWNVDNFGTPGTPQTVSCQVYVTKINLLLEKAQRNFTTQLAGPPYYTTPINASAGDYILYELKVTNNTDLADFQSPPPTSDLTVYNIDLIDMLDNDLVYYGIVAGPTIGSINHDGSPSGGVLNWVINSLAFGETARAVIILQVLDGVSQGSTIPNLTNAVFSVDNTPSKLYNAPQSNTVLLTFENVRMAKTGSVTTAKIGETITYNITTTIPQGTQLYDFKLVDTLPVGQSFYGITGNLLITPPGSSSPVTPIITGETVEFPVIAHIDTVGAAATYTYTFIAQIISGKDFDDYIDVQTNNAEVTWKTAPSGGSTITLTDDYTITVPSPKLILSKVQRDITTGTAYDTEPLFVNIGDMLGYKLIISNIGAATAYNITITDQLDIYHNFHGVSYTPPPPPDNSMNYAADVVTWTIDYIDANQTLEGAFNINEDEQAAAGDHEENIATGYGYTNASPPPAIPIQLPTVTSNEVEHFYHKITITKTADPINAYIGSTIHYTIQFTLAQGTFAYKVILTDVLPIGESYVNDSGIFTDPNSGSIPLNPTISGQVLTIIDTMDITVIHTTDLVYTYSFDAIVNTASFGSTHNQVQTNNTTIQWKFNAQGTEPVDPIEATATASSDVNISCPLRLKLYQRNVNNSSVFTEDTIEAVKGDIVEYKLVVTNITADTLANLYLFDSLSSYLRYIAPTYVPPLATISHTGEPSDGTVAMELLVLPPNATIEFQFTTEVLNLPLTPIINNVFATFNSTPINPSPTGCLYSNSVDIKTNLAAECILANKVFSQCLSKECLKDVKVDGTGSLLNVQFYKGSIIENSMDLEPIPNTPNLYNVRYLVSIGYKAEMLNAGSVYYVEGTLPPIEIYGAMYIPKIEPTNEPIFTVDTFTQILDLNNINNSFTVGIYIVNSVLYTVQLFIPSIDFFSFPPDCVPYVPPYTPSPCKIFKDSGKFLNPDDRE